MDDGRLERIERRMEELDQRESAMEQTMDKAMARSRRRWARSCPARRAVTCARRGGTTCSPCAACSTTGRRGSTTDRTMSHDDHAAGGQGALELRPREHPDRLSA